MRLPLAALLMFTATFATAASQQECEALIKPINTKFAELEKEDKPTPQACARLKDGVKMLEKYVADADKKKCPLGYVNGQAFGGAEERAVALSEAKAGLKAACH